MAKLLGKFRRKAKRNLKKLRAIFLCITAVVLLFYFAPQKSEYSKRSPEELRYLNSLRQKYSGKSRKVSPEDARRIIATACIFLDGAEDNDSKYDTPDARFLLLGTAYVESGFYPRFQDYGGDAIGLFQIEYGTFRDLWKRGIKINHPKIYDAILSEFGAGNRIEFEDLQESDVLCAVFARLKYAASDAPIPPASELESQARYYKKFYNTEFGKGSVEGYMNKVSKLLESEKKEKL